MPRKDPFEVFSQWYATLSVEEKLALADRFMEENGGTLWSNRIPQPVAVALVPVDTNEGRRLLGLRRTVDPDLGSIALPGGFMEEGEDSREASAHEVLKQTGLSRPSSSYVRFGTDRADDDDKLLLFTRQVVPLTQAQFETLASNLATSEAGLTHELVLIDDRTILNDQLHNAAAVGFFRPE